MASVQKRPDGRWRARYRDPAGREVAKHFDRKVDAHAWLSGVTADIARGVYIDPNAGRRLFGEYADQWRNAQVHRATTALQLDTHFRRHVLPTFEKRPLGSVRRSDIQCWVKQLSAELSPATVKVIYRYVAAVFRAAVDDRLIPSSPCSKIPLPRSEQRRVEPLETKVVQALIETIGARYRTLVVTAAGTGLRQGELFGLTLEHLDMLRRTIRVEQQLTLLPGAPPFLGPPKTEASRRTVPLPQVVVDALAAHLAEFGAGDDGLIFTDDAGHAIRRSAFSVNVWRPAAAKVGIPSGTAMHALRHYYASLLIRHGESVKTVQMRLGHASASETLDTYSHLWPDSDDRTREAVDAVLRAHQDREVV